VRRPIAAVAAALLLAACTQPSQTQQARQGRAGLQLSGTLAGRQVAVSDGGPEFVVGDCDPPDGPDEDVCALARDLDGTLFALVFENPDVLRPDAVLDVGAPCANPEQCDLVGDRAVVRVQSGTGRRLTATGGEVRLRLADKGRRYVGDIRLVLPGGRLSGSFDLVPRPAE
jgi:hypothetical protein